MINEMQQELRVVTQRLGDGEENRPIESGDMAGGHVFQLRCAAADDIPCLKTFRRKRLGYVVGAALAGDGIFLAPAAREVFDAAPFAVT